MVNFDKYRDKIFDAVNSYKKDIFDQLDCQLHRIRAGNAPCKKGFLNRGCRSCNVETLEWLTEEVGKDGQKNCERYADLIEEAVTNATDKGLNPACGMYMFRIHGTTDFNGVMYDVLNSIDCDNDCEWCRKTSVEWLTESEGGSYAKDSEL